MSASGATPLDPDYSAGLKPNLATQGELNEWERQNILAAREWAFGKRVLGLTDPLDEIYLRMLHKKMFGETWEWAGSYRKKNLNIGCPFADILQRVPILLGNVRHWVDHKVYGVDEIAVRFHHHLVWQIHAFPNGNGRHARMIADVLVTKLGRPVFTWGPTGDDPATVRENYLAALRTLDTDDRDVRPLLEFARS